ncbi:MAG: hypothetical protein LWX56_14785 [Ignavibacteria bacterium]|nr:hypothetical protein [Ignavibacteria bacterium]
MSLPIPILHGQEAHSENEFYFSIAFSYSTGLLPGALYNQSSEGAPAALPNSQSNRELFSVGHGPGINLVSGYHIWRNLSGEIGINYVKGVQISWDEGNPSPNPIVSYFFHSSVLTIRPSIRLELPDYLHNLKPYIRGSLIIAIPTIDYDRNTWDRTMAVNSYEECFSIKSNRSLGIGFDIGSNYFISPQLAVFTELGFTYLSYKPTTRTQTKYTLYGTDIMQTLPYRDMQYTQNVTYTSGEIPQEYFSLSSAAIRIGFQYSF